MFISVSRAELRRRLPQLMIGLVVVGFGFALMVEANLGLGPWEALHQGISNRIGIPIGTVKTRTHAAMRKLRKALEREDEA